MFPVIPQLFVVIVVATIVTPSRVSLTLVIGLLSSFRTARLVRGEALPFGRLEYVDAARFAGSASSGRSSATCCRTPSA